MIYISGGWVTTPPLIIFYGQASRPISKGQLHALTALPHPSYQRGRLPRAFRGLLPGNLISRKASRLYAFSGYPFELRYPAMPLARQPVHKRFARPGPLVLRTDPHKFPAPTRDRDRTVSRRSKPSSRTALTGEQPDPWDLLQPQDAMSRHRGAKPCRRCELLGKISLLSPAYLLSVERWPFHAEPPDH